MTLREYDALLTRKMEHDNRVQFNAGIVAAAVYNAAPFGGEKREAINPVEFVPAWNSRKNGPNDMTEWEPEKQRDYMVALFSSRGDFVQRERQHG